MKVRSTFFNWGIPAIALTLLIFLVAWVGNPQIPQGNTSNNQDTIPTKKKIKPSRESGEKDLDKELRQLDNAKDELETLKPLILENMKSALPLPNGVPVEAEVGYGDNWLVAH